MTAWAHLPNAALINEVLASVKTNPKKWGAGQGVVWGAAWSAARSAARSTAWSATRRAAWEAVLAAFQSAAWDAARSAVQSPSWNAAWDAAWDAAATLVAYDDAGQFMRLPAEHLQRLYRIDPHPMFLLLQPAAIVFNEQRNPACLS